MQMSPSLPQFWLVFGAVIAAVVVAGLNVLIPKLLGELIDVLARLGILGGGGSRAPVDNGSGDSTSFKLVSYEFLAKIKGPSIVLIGEWRLRLSVTYCVALQKYPYLHPFIDRDVCCSRFLHLLLHHIPLLRWGECCCRYAQKTLCLFIDSGNVGGNWFIIYELENI